MALITAGLAYLLVSDTGERAADEDLTQIAVGRTVGLADEIGNRPPRAADPTLAGITAEGYSAWVFDNDGRLRDARIPRRASTCSRCRARAAGCQSSLIGSRYINDLPGGVTVVAVPIFRNGTIDGAILGRSARAPAVQHAIEELRGTGSRRSASPSRWPCWSRS